MEIEKKFLIDLMKMPVEKLAEYPHSFLEQGYLCVNPVVRVRKEDDTYYMTYKGGGMMAREEYNLPLTKSGYEHLLQKADGIIISKTRYLVPISTKEALTAEVDVFHRDFEGLIFAEVEFSSIEQAEAFTPPDWFSEEVTYDERYHNSYMSRNPWFKK